jgi:hypothetical protein
MISTGNPAANPAVARDVTRGELQPGHGGQRRGNQAALQRDRREAIGLSRYRLHRRGGPVGGHLQQLDVVIGKPAGREGADMHHADHPAARHHRHPHHGLDALGPQDRVQHGRVIDVVHDHRLVLGGDPPGEPLAHRDAHALADLFLQPGGRGRDQLTGRDVKQQDRGGIGLQHPPDPVQELGQQLTIIKAGQCRIGYRLNGPQPGFSRFRIYLRGHLDASRIEDLLITGADITAPPAG